jgi:hypothetical protein
MTLADIPVPIRVWIANSAIGLRVKFRNPSV